MGKGPLVSTLLNPVAWMLPRQDGQGADGEDNAVGVGEGVAVVGY